MVAGFLQRLRFLRFCLVGATGFAVDALVLLLLLNIFGDHPLLARIPSIALAIFTTWLLNHYFTFQMPAPPSLRNWWRYVALNLAVLTVNLSVYVLALKHLPIMLLPEIAAVLHWNDMQWRAFLSLILATSASLSLNYAGMVFVVFKTRDNAS